MICFFRIFLLQFLICLIFLGIVMNLNDLSNNLKEILYNYSDDEQDAFLSFYEKNKYYLDGYGISKEVDDALFEKVAYQWTSYPNELKNKNSLLSVAKYVQSFNEKVYSYDVSLINQNTNSDFSDYIIPEKEFALSQINFAKDYFPSDQEYWKICKNLLQLPDDKKTIYDFLNQYSMLNLNYVPNKIRLIDDYMPDKLNISFIEKELFIKNKSLKYEDFVGFQNKQNNFSYNNYLRCVDNIVGILSNDLNAPKVFRKDFQYNNIDNALYYNDYAEYNWNCAYNFDDEDYDEQFQNEDILKEERCAYVVNENMSPYQIYQKNFDFISNSALNLCRTFGNQAESFLSRFLEVYDKNFVPNIPKQKFYLTPEMEFEDDINFLSEKQFKITNRINEARLKQFSLLQNKREKIEEFVPEKLQICSLSTQKKILEFLELLPTDFSKAKYDSFNKFMNEDFFYKDKNQNLCARPLDEIKKIIKIWPQLTKEQENLPYKDILSLSSVDDYLNAQKSNFVATAKLNHLSPELFDIAQSAYIRGLDTPRVIQDNYEYKTSNYTLRLMDIKDPNIMFIGNGFSCQTIDKAGAYPALSSVQDPFSRAMIVEQKGKTVGLAWLWVSQEQKYGKNFQSLCFDNLELTNFVVCDAEEILNGLQKMSIKIAEENNFLRVTLGSKATHYSATDYFNETHPLGLPLYYQEQNKYEQLQGKIDYGDSAHQVLVYENSLAQPLKDNDDSQYFIAHRDAYSVTNDEINQALNIGTQAYGWQAEFREQDKNSKFLLMKNYQNQVVGYALFSDVDHHVHDVAVHPDYRRYSKKMLFELLRHMKDVGGVWEAETRKDTSYALLTRLNKTGMIHLEEKDTYIGIQGEKLYKTFISFPQQNDEILKNKIKGQSVERI